MKVFITSSAIGDGKHLQKGTVQEVSKEAAEALVANGKATFTLPATAAKAPEPSPKEPEGKGGKK